MADEGADVADGTVSDAAASFEGLLSGKKPEPKPAPKTTPDPRRSEAASADDDAAADEPREPGPDDIESDNEGASGDDNAPSIDPPKSMPEELRADFSKLPPTLQKFLVDRERNIEKGGAKVAGKASDERKAMEASRIRYDSELLKIAHAATQFRHPDIVAFESKFKDVIEGKTDLQALKDSDPIGRFMDYTIARQKAADGWNQEQAIQAHFRQQQEESGKRYLDEQIVKLRDMVPVLQNDVKWTAFDKDVSNYVLQHAARYGELPEKAAAMLRQGSAWALEMAWKAMKYDRASQKIRDAETKPANGKVLRPGNAERRDGQTERFKAHVNRLSKTGRTEDAAAAFGVLLNRK